LTRFVTRHMAIHFAADILEEVRDYRLAVQVTYYFCHNCSFYTNLLISWEL